MTTLYKPVKIESAEQAEALPIGTMAAQAEEGPWPALVCIRVEWGWNCTGMPDEAGEPFLVGHGLMVGDTALVPIEADEEILHQDTLTTSEQLRRYTTPWQRFTAPKEAP